MYIHDISLQISPSPAFFAPTGRGESRSELRREAVRGVAAEEAGEDHAEGLALGHRKV